MKAIVYDRYGPPDVLRLQEMERPVPKEDEVRVRVHAASINAGDRFARTGRPFLFRLFSGGILRPKTNRLGIDLAGQVEEVGKNVQRFRPGDVVFGCRNGAFAEQVCAREGLLALKPANLSFVQAAAVPWAALVALQTIRFAGDVQPGQRVLIQGASGGVGTFAIQIARALGAEVTAACSTRNLEIARSIGASHVIDYTREDFTRGAARYDLILAFNGYHPLAAYRRALNSQGIYICGGGTLGQILEARLFGSLASRRGGRQMRLMGGAKVIREDLAFLTQLLEADRIVPVIDRTYRLNDIVEAFRYLEDSHARGKIVIDFLNGASQG